MKFNLTPYSRAGREGHGLQLRHCSVIPLKRLSYPGNGYLFLWILVTTSPRFLYLLQLLVFANQLVSVHVYVLLISVFFHRLPLSLMMLFNSIQSPFALPRQPPTPVFLSKFSGIVGASYTNASTEFPVSCSIFLAQLNLYNGFLRLKPHNPI